jgi:shikimate 5-dehydrogenase/shikimate kinase/3-dehydroquinate dehydratase
MAPAVPTSYNPSAARWTRSYGFDASIALVGIRGTGLSTLAVFAANLLNFELLDADHQFYQATGLSRAKFRSSYGMDKYRNAESSLLRSMLLGHPSKTVIVCGPGAVEATGQALLSAYALDHLVIYVSRDIQGIQDHLRVWDSNTISSIYRASTPTLRSVSNFEFYNSTHSMHEDSYPNDRRKTGSSLALKRVEQSFALFLQSVTAQKTFCEEQHHLQLLAQNGRQFTSALTVYAPVPATFWSDVIHEDFLADAIELIVPTSMLGTDLGEFDHSDADFMTQQYHSAKSAAHVPIILSIESINNLSAPTNAMCYFEALHHGLRLSPDFLCVDLTYDRDLIRRLIAVKGRTKVIADYSESAPSSGNWNSPKWRDMVHLAKEIGADAVRLRQETTAVEDNFAVRHFVDQITASNQSKITVIAYNTGFPGKMSRFMGAHLNPVTDSRLQSQATRDQQGQLLTVRDAQVSLYSSFVLDAMQFGIYGNNVNHSLSPAMHNAAFEASGMPHTYRAFQNSSLEQLKTLISNPNVGGLSVTAPFKTQVLPLVHQISHEAEIIGAINTLIPIRSHDGFLFSERNRAGTPVALYGDNTDWIGIRDCIQANLSPVNAINHRTTALVIGAGGMARAATYALLGLGVRQLFFHNRTCERAQALVNYFEEENRLLAISKAYQHGSATLPTDIHNDLRMQILAEKSNVWPHDVKHPTIIVSCIATKDIGGECSVDTSLPPAWLASKTGGVALEVCSFS